MVGRKRTAAQTSSGGRLPAGAGAGSIYQDMLAEAGVSSRRRSSPDRPLKRRRPGPKAQGKTTDGEPNTNAAAGSAATDPDAAGEDDDDDDDDDVEFEDVALPAPTVQTMEMASDDDEGSEDDDEGMMFEDVDFAAPLKDTESKDKQKELEINLSAQKAASTPSKRTADRRKPMTNEERQRRVDIHKTHVLCLLYHAYRRNHWCNDAKVQDHLRPHLTDKAVNYLLPGPELPQFGQAESLKNGLKMAGEVWKTKFDVTERGLRRALWAEDSEQLQNYELPDDMEACLDRQDMRDAAARLEGSRDVGAQLYCALLRSVGVRARLVCSLQPLTFMSGGPTLPRKASVKPKSAKAARNEKVEAQLAMYEAKPKDSPSASPGPSTPRRRFGHPSAGSYNFEPKPSPPKRPAFSAPKNIRESSYPVYWVEILDAGHQKWQPVDPMVTKTFWKPRVLEPPMTDKENYMCYVVAFDADGTAKDVTRRYSKAYSAKTRKTRVDGVVDGGEQWWRKAMRPFQKKFPSDLDQIEDIELAGVEAREPMPRNVQDFKDHPVYALERHFRRTEVLTPSAKPSGTVGAGSKGPLEKIFRRRDVRVARSADKWYRMGREVKPNEIPAKWLPKKAKSRFGDDDDGEGDAGTPIYTEDQTELYEPPPVRNGRVPKNKFGNIDIYTSSMVPRGGVYLNHEYAARASFILGIDYAPALTGFQFKGRHGTAVLNGVVVAAEYEEAIRAVIDGLNDVEQEIENERRRLVALKMWRRMLMGLRIRERIWSGVDKDERQRADDEAAGEAKKEEDFDAAMEGAASDETEEFDMVEDDDEGGGFVRDDGGGGFMADDDDYGGGGFMT